MPKLGSKKSREGCVNCKRRRVKCDEQHPRCGACTKYNMQCHWPPHTTGTTSPGASASGRAHRVPKDETFDDSTAAGSGSEVNGGLHLLADAASAVNNNYTVLHLELMHYYLTKTVLTVCRHNDIEVWRDAIPRYAYGRPWLMNGMLAIAALHRAHDDHSMAHICIPLAMDMLNVGLPNLQTLIPMVDDPDNGNAIVAYATLVGIYSMGLLAVQQHHGGAPRSPLDALLHIFDLARGTAHIYEKAYHVVREGPLKPITQVSILKNADPTSLHLAPTFQRRTTLEKIDELDRWLDEANEPQEKIAACKVAHERLFRVAFNILMSNEPYSGHETLPWIAMLDGDYIDSLRERYPPAMTILVYFCLLLRDECWYTKGWRAWILDSTDALTLPVPWGDLVLWAQHQVNTDREFLDVRTG